MGEVLPLPHRRALGNLLRHACARARAASGVSREARDVLSPRGRARPKPTSGDALLDILLVLLLRSKARLEARLVVLRNRALKARQRAVGHRSNQAGCCQSHRRSGERTAKEEHHECSCWEAQPQPVQRPTVRPLWSCTETQRPRAVSCLAWVKASTESARLEKGKLH